MIISKHVIYNSDSASILIELLPSVLGNYRGSGFFRD